MSRRSSVAAVRPTVDFTLAIAERAYYKAERRGFVPGHELEDWLAAEREISAHARPLPVADPPKKPAARRKNGAASKPK